jgi:hypothetical protein
MDWAEHPFAVLREQAGPVDGAAKSQVVIGAYQHALEAEGSMGVSVTVG